ncbi:hypothetical protein SKAU_G00228020 [Synaphobranchus kaupii]|uniref:Rho-GAP domain-containing protein n=1 Tax=Synaphobranchus kaupii TaxID=118154 RepID=A0A9Q1IT22_SYNKA|nr:hypothetical protein SKAU_G00228020 [Synaphobranchus kaupii]
MSLFCCLHKLFTRAKGLSLPWTQTFSEHEAKEACDWLRAAGFPQYAHLYEDGLFPIDISSVKKDHDFLDQDSLKSLCRRLTVLNKCASMKLEVHFQRKESEDSEEDDLCAISDRWAFQRDSKRWSRLGALSYPSPSLGVEHAQTSEGEWGSRESILSDLSDLGAASLHSNSSLSVQSARIASSSSTVASSSHSDPPPAQAPPPGRARPKRRTKSFLRRIESFRRREKESERAEVDAEDTPLAASVDTPPPASLVCTAGDSLPGGGGRSRSPFARRALTLGRVATGTVNGPNAAGRRGRTQSGGFYLDDFQVLPGSSDPREQRGRGRPGNVVHLPPDHKPGTFPRSLSVESMCPPGSGEDREAVWRVGGAALDACAGGAESADSPGFLGRRRSSCGSEGSVYDNVPEPPRDRTPQEGGGDISQDLDDILQRVQGLQHSLHMWSRKICPEMEDEEEGEDEEEEGSLISGGTAETVCTPSLLFEERSISDLGTAASDVDSTGNSLNEAEELEMRERRDSGVGASLTRPNRKLRWHSFQNSHRPSLTSASLEINRQSAAQLNILQKFSLLRLTATMERYSVPSKQGWSWTVPKFMKRSKAPDYRDKNVFGVPPLVNVQRSGQPLPQSIQQAMRYLRSRWREQVGIFRKSGVKSRIQALRRLNEGSPDHVDYEGQSAYDVADMLKQYFRDLPEPVFTAKLTETFLQIYQWVPKEQQLQAAQAAVILLPDESREVLQTLLYFLSDIASAQDNQMTAGNLAVCLAPSVFHLNVSKKEGSSPRLIQGRSTTSKPDHRDLNENMAATHGLGHMILECKKLFQIPHDMMLQSRSSYLAADTHPLPLHGLGINLKGEPVDYRAFLEDSVQCLLRETVEKSRGWHGATAPDNTELA